MNYNMKNLTTIKEMALTTCLCAFCLNATATEDKDTTVVIPESGHLAIKMSRNFTGPSNVIVSNYYGSGNATSKGLVFQNQQMGPDVVVASQANSSSGLILTARPGTYTLTLTDRTATKQFFSTSVSWVEEPATIDGTSKENVIYKFVNEKGHIGFERDEKYADKNYQMCDMAEGDHIYFGVSKKCMQRITTTMQTTAAELQFIPWDKTLWGCPLPEDIAVSATLGDANGDGKIDTQDVVAVVNKLTGNATADFQEKAADVNADRVVNVADVVGVVNLILKK